LANGQGQSGWFLATAISGKLLRIDWHESFATHRYERSRFEEATLGEAVDKLGLSSPQVDALKKKEIAMVNEKLDRETQVS